MRRAILPIPQNTGTKLPVLWEDSDAVGSLLLQPKRPANSLLSIRRAEVRDWSSRIREGLLRAEHEVDQDNGDEDGDVGDEGSDGDAGDGPDAVTVVVMVMVIMLVIVVMVVMVVMMLVMVW